MADFMDAARSFVAKSDYDRPRNLFPLPTEAFEPDALGHGVSRKVRRRLERHANSASWKQDAVKALNSLYCGSDRLASSRPRLAKPSQAQRSCLDIISKAVDDCGKPPQDVTGSGALTELRARLTYGEPASLTKTDVKLVSLPAAGSKPVGVECIAKQQAHSIIGSVLDKVVDVSIVKERKAANNFKRPYYDSNLRELVGCIWNF